MYRNEVIRMVNDVCNNTRDLQTGAILDVPVEREEEFVKAIMNLGKQVPMNFIKNKLEDIIRLSQISPKDEQDKASVAYVKGILRIISEGMNDNRQITFFTSDSPEKIKKGFLKSNLIPVFNDCTLAMEKIGQTLGVLMAKTYVTDFEGKRFIISEDVAGENKTFLTMQEFNEKYGSEWPRAQELDEKLKNLIQYPIQAVENYSDSEIDCEKFRQDYIRMICFDYITNQTDRNDGNYGVLIGINREVSLAPIFDSDYILKDPSVPENNNPFSLNKKYDKDDGLGVLASLYPKEVAEFLEQLNAKESEIMEIADEFLSVDMLDGKGNYRNLLSRNIERFREIALSRGIGLGIEESKNKPSISMRNVVVNAVRQGISREDVAESDKIEHRERILEQGREETIENE